MSALRRESHVLPYLSTCPCPHGAGRARLSSPLTLPWGKDRTWSRCPLLLGFSIRKGNASIPLWGMDDSTHTQESWGHADPGYVAIPWRQVQEKEKSVFAHTVCHIHYMHFWAIATITLCICIKVYFQCKKTLFFRGKKHKVFSPMMSAEES